MADVVSEIQPGVLLLYCEFEMRLHPSMQGIPDLHYQRKREGERERQRMIGFEALVRKARNTKSIPRRRKRNKARSYIENNRYK